MTQMTMYQRRDDWVGTQVEDQFVMIHLDSGRYIALNDSAAQAWLLLEQPRDRASLVAELTRVFDVDEDKCGASVDRLMERMRALDLVSEVA